MLNEMKTFDCGYTVFVLNLTVYLLVHGAIGDRLCWYPLEHLLHVRPITPSLHGHCPVVWLHD
jgi:hypothetical protein